MEPRIDSTNDGIGLKPAGIVLVRDRFKLFRLFTEIDGLVFAEIKFAVFTKIDSKIFLGTTSVACGTRETLGYELVLFCTLPTT
jgi:hypothetical protein